VRSTFVDREWTQGNGTFHFTKSGQYTYVSDELKLSGTYKIDPNGTLCAVNEKSGPAPNRKTCYTFYRKKGGYEYYHDRSDKYWPARFN